MSDTILKLTDAEFESQVIKSEIPILVVINIILKRELLTY